MLILFRIWIQEHFPTFSWHYEFPSRHSLGCLLTFYSDIALFLLSKPSLSLMLNFQSMDSRYFFCVF